MKWKTNRSGVAKGSRAIATRFGKMGLHFDEAAEKQSSVMVLWACNLQEEVQSAVYDSAANSRTAVTYERRHKSQIQNSIVIDQHHSALAIFMHPISLIMSRLGIVRTVSRKQEVLGGGRPEKNCTLWRPVPE